MPKRRRPLSDQSAPGNLRLLSARQIAERCSVSPRAARIAVMKHLGRGTCLFGEKLERWPEQRVIELINRDIARQNGFHTGDVSADEAMRRSGEIARQTRDRATPARPAPDDDWR